MDAKRPGPARNAGTRRLVWLKPEDAVVAETDTPILDIDEDRTGLVLVNNTTNRDIFLAFGHPAVIDRGIRLNRGGGSYEMNDTNLSVQRLNGVANGPGAILSVLRAQ